MSHQAPPAAPVPPATTSLAERILDAFPSGTYALTALLRLLDVVETDRVPTAAVECRTQPRLLINPRFVAQHAATPEKLLMLVMHELHHVLLGHTTLFPRLTPVQNFVFDAVINGLICRMFPSAAHTAFVCDYYRDDSFPECLLRPTPGWPEGGFGRAVGVSKLGPALGGNWVRRCADIHAALYSEAGASYREVFELLPRVFRAAGQGSVQAGTPGPGSVDDIPLLGGHASDEAEHQGLEKDAPLMFDLVRDLVEQWPQPPDPIRGRSLSDVLRQQDIKPRRPPSCRPVLRRLILKVAGERFGGRSRRVDEDRLGTAGPIPSLARRSLVLQTLGTPVLLHDTPLPWRRAHRQGQRVHVYLDVSGSMESVLGALYGAALDCRDLLHPRIHLFSTRVVDVSLAQLRAGHCQTTGGTSIDAVAEHMVRNGVRRALIVTDGWVGKPAGTHRDTLRKARLAVALMGDQPNRGDLAEVADHTAVLQT